ncbi:effector-binding domain-containing protein/DNA-binding transcriptional MerR regulator [Methanolinea mesophila]|nr:effector-binding domain-containing protein/DNA-binding transcriptional MerR regulator [Methanolinea mesophila]
MPADRITIGRFSRLTYLSQKALRLYDTKGILVPKVKDRITGYRYYSIGQIDCALKIRTLCSLGFGLSDISAVLSALESGDEETVLRMLNLRHRETLAEIRRLEKIQSLLLEKRDFSELFAMNVSEPVIKDVPALRVISGRKTGTYEGVCSEVGSALFAIIFSPLNQRNGVTITGPCISLCYDGEYRETDADIEMAVPVQGPVVSDKPTYTVRTLPAEKVVSVVYKGPYEHDGFSVAFENAFRFANEHGLEIKGPDRQVYLNDPDATPAEELLTEIQIPIVE